MMLLIRLSALAVEWNDMHRNNESDINVFSPVRKEMPKLFLKIQQKWMCTFRKSICGLTSIVHCVHCGNTSIEDTHFYNQLLKICSMKVSDYCYTWRHTAARNKSKLAAVCSSEIFTQRYCRCNNDKEIKLISVTLMWQQIIHGSIRSHFHSTTQKQRIPWSMAVNGRLYQPSWNACLITHSSTTVPRVVDFPNGHRFTDQRGTVRRTTCFSMHRAQMPSCCKCVKL